MRKHAALTLMLSLCTAINPVKAEEIKLTDADNAAMSVSIYNQNLAFVRDTRKVNLPAGDVTLAFEGVAQQMQPDTAMVEAPQVAVLEKNYEYDLLDYTNLLNEYVGKEVKTVMTSPADGSNIFDKAVVLNAAYGTPLLKFSYGVEGNFPGRVVFDQLPENLRVKPTLVTKLKNENAGEKNLQLSYLSGGLSWQADYVAELAGEDTMDVQGFVTLNNQSGTDYKNASVQLVSGEISQPTAPQQPQPRMMMMAKAASFDAAEAAPANGGNLMPTSLGEYYVYTLPLKTDILDKQSKQVSFLNLSGLKYQSIYRLVSPLNVSYVSGSTWFEHQNPRLYYKIVNEQEKNLPQGNIRFYEKGAGGELQFVSGTEMPQLAKGEKAELSAGKSGDVFVDGKLTATRKIAEKTTENDYEVVFNNAKDKAVTVEFEQKVYGDVTVVKESLKNEADNAGNLKWKVEVPAGGNMTLTFSLRVTRN